MAKIKLARELLAAMVVAVCALPCEALSEEHPPPRYTSFDASAGIHQYLPGNWAMISVGAVNFAEEPTEVLSAMFFEGHPNVQYGRTLWIPARARRNSWYPIRLPENIPAEKKRATLKSLLMERSAGKEGLMIESPSGRVFHDGMLAVIHERPTTAVIADEEDDDEPRDAVAALRQSGGLDIRAPNLRGRPMPPGPETLEALDLLVLSSDRIDVEAAGLKAMRRWLHNGGRMWIMLDQVQPATVSKVLGDAFRCHVVDRVELTEIQVEEVRNGEKIAVGQRREFEDPVEMVRVVGPTVKPTHLVNGWPASFWQPAGSGLVLFTTLGPRGWYRQRLSTDPRPKDPLKRSTFVATEPLRELGAGSRFGLLRQRAAPTLEPEEFHQLVTEQIGYRIVDRRTVIFVLGGFCLVLLVSGLLLVQVGKLEYLGWIGPTLAVVATVALVSVGRASKTAVPDTVAAAQLVEVTPGLDDVRVSGMMAIYNQGKSTARLGVRSGGVFYLDMAGMGGAMRRMLWTDMDRWHWEHLTLPSGVRTAPFTYATEMDQPVAARATFGPEGITGRLSAGEFGDVRDAVIATHAKRGLAVRLGHQGSFAAGPGDVLAAGQFIGGAVLSDQQSRQQQVYRQLLQGGIFNKYPPRPTLLAWASPLDTRFTFAAGAQRTGEALIAVPLVFDRPAPDTEVVIPAPLLPYRTVPIADQVAGSMAYDYLEGKWLGPLAAGAKTMLRFECPAEILPLRVQRAKLSVAINAPSRELEIAGLLGDRIVTLASHQSPVGVMQFDIRRTDVLQPDSGGGILLGVNVGDLEGEGMDSTIKAGWKIDEVRLEITGRTLTP